MVLSRIEELRRRLERDPGSRLFAQLAEEIRKSGDLAEAVRVARAGLAVHASYPAALLTLGRALLDSGDAAGARRELEEALRQAPDNILAGRFLAQALEAVGDLTGALARYRATLKMAPGDRQLEAQIEGLRRRLAPPAAAADVVPRAEVAATPAAPAGAEAPGSDAPGSDAPPFWSSTLAELYLRQGFRERAIEVYKHVVAANPRDERARSRLLEVEAVASDGGSESSGAADGRRRALELTIMGLEALLAAARRR